jgi:hypothetical protein
MEGEDDSSASVSSRGGDMMQERASLKAISRLKLNLPKSIGVSYDQDARMMERKL